eukprot:286259-Amphidinium_carterae.1
MCGVRTGNVDDLVRQLMREVPAFKENKKLLAPHDLVYPRLSAEADVDNDGKLDFYEILAHSLGRRKQSVELLVYDISKGVSKRYSKLLLGKSGRLNVTSADVKVLRLSTTLAYSSLGKSFGMAETSSRRRHHSHIVATHRRKHAWNLVCGGRHTDETFKNMSLSVQAPCDKVFGPPLTTSTMGLSVLMPSAVPLLHLVMPSA